MSEHVDIKDLGVCGEYCGVCVFFTGEKQPRCLGCRANPEMGSAACSIFKCCRSLGVANCSVCAEFPCHALVHGYNPSNPDGPRNALVRVAMTAYRARHGDEETIELWLRLPNQPRQEPHFPCLLETKED
jgi:hypothetical protein